MPTAERRALQVLLLTGMAAGAGLAFVPPRITLVNAAMRIEYAWTAWAGALIAAGCAATLCALFRPRIARAAFGGAALAGVVLALARLSYDIEAGPEALRSRRLVGRTALPWREVTRVASETGAIDVWAADGRHVRIDTGQFRADQRAALDRAVSRRVRESAR